MGTSDTICSLDCQAHMYMYSIFSSINEQCNILCACHQTQAYDLLALIQVACIYVVCF